MLIRIYFTMVLFLHALLNNCMDLSSGTAADYDPLIIDCSNEICQANIEKLITDQASHCGIVKKIGVSIARASRSPGDRYYSHMVSPRQFRFYPRPEESHFRNWWHHIVIAKARYLPFFVQNGAKNNYIKLDQDHAQIINYFLQKKEQKKLAKKETTFINQEIMAIRHELGHEYHMSDSLLLENSVPGIFAISTIFWVSLLYPPSSNNMFEKVICTIDALILSYITSNFALSLLYKDHEADADDFSIRCTKMPDLLKDRGKFYKKMHDDEDKTIFAKLKNLNLLFFGKDTHPSNYLRYQKFKKAYTKIRQIND